jgi:hypothetical protein
MISGTFQDGLAVVDIGFTTPPKYFRTDYDLHPFGTTQVIDFSGKAILQAKENERFLCQREGYLLKEVFSETFQIPVDAVKQKWIYGTIMDSYRNRAVIPSYDPTVIRWIFRGSELAEREAYSQKIVNIVSGKELLLPPGVKFGGCFEYGLTIAGIGIEHQGTDGLKAKQYGYIGKDGKFVIPPRYSRARNFQRNGFAQVEKDKVTFFIDRRGNRVSDQIGKTIFSEGLAVRYTSTGKRTNQVIDTKYKVVFTLPQGFEFDDDGLVFSSGLIRVRSTKMECTRDSRCYGYVDRRGKVAIAAQFRIANPFDQGLANVEANNQWSYINPQGKIIWKD